MTSTPGRESARDEVPPESPSPPTDMPIRFRLTRGTYFSLLGTVVTVLANFIVSIVLARFLGARALGIYGLYTVIGVVAIPLIALSIPSAITRFTADLRHRDPYRLSLVLPTGFLTILLAGVVGSLVMFIVIAPEAGRVYADADLALMLQILAAALIANLLALFFDALLQGLEQFQTTNLIGAISAAAVALAMIALVPIVGISGAAWAAALGAALLAGAAITTAVRAMRSAEIGWRWTYDRGEARSLFSFVGPLNVASIVVRMSVLIQTSLVAVIVGFVDLGLLRVAGVFFGAMLFLPRIFLGPALPILTSMTATRSSESVRKGITTLMKLSLILIAPLAAGLILALPSLIVFLYGSEFSAALPFAILVILAAVFAVPNSLLGEQYLIATGRTKTSLLVTLYSVAVSLGLVVVLLPSQGALALPVASLVAESTLFAILVGVAGRRDELDVARLVPTLALCLAVAAAVGVAQLAVSLPLGIFLAVPVWAGVFFGGLFFFLSAEERSALRSVFQYMSRKLRGR